MATQIKIGGFPYRIPSSYTELDQKRWRNLAKATNRAEIIEALCPLLPATQLTNDAQEVIFALLEWITEEPEFLPSDCPAADEWEWRQLEEVRELIASDKFGYPWLKAIQAAEILGRESFRDGLTAITYAITFLSKFTALFEYEMTDEHKQAGAESLLQFKYYVAADRLAKEWNMTPAQALKEKAGDAYLKMLYDLTKNDIDERLQENN